MTHEEALETFAAEITATLGPVLVGIYLEGSFAWGDPVATSDLDLRIVTENPVTDEQRKQLVDAAERVQGDLGREIGIRFDALPDLVRVGAVRFQRSRLVAGTDIRDRVPLKPIEAFARDSMLTAHDLIVGLRGEGPLSLPMTTPAPGAEFRGYDTLLILDRGKWVDSSKRLVSNVTAIATALIAFDAKAYVHSKGEVPARYAKLIGGEWRRSSPTSTTRVGCNGPTGCPTAPPTARGSPYSAIAPPRSSRFWFRAQCRSSAPCPRVTASVAASRASTGREPRQRLRGPQKQNPATLR